MLTMAFTRSITVANPVDNPIDQETQCWIHMSTTPPAIIKDATIVVDKGEAKEYLWTAVAKPSMDEREVEEYLWASEHLELCISLVCRAARRHNQVSEYTANELANDLTEQLILGRRWYRFKDRGDPVAFRNFLWKIAELFTRDYLIKTSKERDWLHPSLYRRSEDDDGDRMSAIVDRRRGTEPPMRGLVDHDLVVEFLHTLSSDAKLETFRFITHLVLGSPRPHVERGAIPESLIREYMSNFADASGRDLDYVEWPELAAMTHLRESLDEMAAAKSLERGLIASYQYCYPDLSEPAAKSRLQQFRKDYRVFRKKSLQSARLNQEFPNEV